MVNHGKSQLGYFGRVNYAFKNKYLVEGNLRYDGSSKFPEFCGGDGILLFPQVG